MLLVLTLRGPSTPPEISLATGAVPEEGAALEPVMAGLERAGLVERGGAPDAARFALSAAGRQLCGQIVAREAAQLRASLDASYPPFSDLNRTVKALLYRWQVRGDGASAVPNDHRDLRYDAVVLADLGAAARQAGNLLEPVVVLRARYAAYVSRMREALAGARRGDRSRVAGIRIDSFHAAWWELHADLLLMLGRERGPGDA